MSVGIDTDMAEANARRIVACVNACAGLETESLELYGLHGAELPDVIKLSEQNAELVELLRPKQPRGCDCERCDCGNQGSAESVAAWDAQNYMYQQAIAAHKVSA